MGCDGAVVVHNDSRYTYREAVFQVCFFGLCPVRKRSAVWRRSTVINREYPVDNHQRHPFGIVCRTKRLDTVLYHRGNSIRPAMLQNSKTRTYAVRCEYSMKIKGKQGDGLCAFPQLLSLHRQLPEIEARYASIWRVPFFVSSELFFANRFVTVQLA